MSSLRLAQLGAIVQSIKDQLDLATQQSTQSVAANTAPKVEASTEGRATRPACLHKRADDPECHSSHERHTCEARTECGGLTQRGDLMPEQMTQIVTAHQKPSSSPTALENTEKARPK